MTGKEMTPPGVGAPSGANLGNQLATEYTMPQAPNQIGNPSATQLALISRWKEEVEHQFPESTYVGRVMSG